LTTDIQPDFDGRWSPDGRWVAFVSSRGGQTDVWIVPSAGGDALRVTNDLAIEQSLSWRPDGRGLTFTSSTNVQQVRIVPIEGGEPRLVSFTDYPAVDARVSPDGVSILFVSTRSGNNDIWVVPAAGGDPRPSRPAHSATIDLTGRRTASPSHSVRTGAEAAASSSCRTPAAKRACSPIGGDRGRQSAILI
jgi:Tol biopolymer transport system component